MRHVGLWLSSHHTATKKQLVIHIVCSKYSFMSMVSVSKMQPIVSSYGGRSPWMPNRGDPVP